MGGISRRALAFVRWLLAREQLPSAPSGRGAADSHPQTFASWLLSGDELADESLMRAPQLGRRGLLSRLLSSERLPATSGEPRGVGRSGLGFWQWVFGAEELPQRGELQSQIGSQQPFLRWVLTTEACPAKESPVRQRRREFWAWLLSAEVCAQTEAPPRRQGGFWHWLLAPEACPQVEESRGHRRTGFFRRVFSREEL